MNYDINTIHDLDKSKYEENLCEKCNKDTINELLIKQINETPDKTALICGEEKITYKELGNRAGRLVQELQLKGVTEGAIVAVMVDRSIDMIVSMVAVLMAGAAYLPIDPSNPKERIEYMVNESNSALIMTNTKYLDLVDINVHVIDIDYICYENKDYALDNVNTAGDLAYVIYTSGSTGKPKGIMVEHGSVVNFIKGIKEKIQFAEGKTIINITTISFDIMFLESLLPLTCGLRVVIADKNKYKNPRIISELIYKYSVDIMQATPSTIQLILSDDNAGMCLSSLSQLIVGGEEFPMELLLKLKKICKGTIYNAYGPTETTIWSTICNLSEKNIISIGEPLLNTSLYIIDENNPESLNITEGELCIAGHGLARGYVNNSELTREKFVENSFTHQGKMYKTGDIVRRLSNGEITYVGRKDNQIKIRGYRIEINGIISCILKSGLVKQVAIDVKASTDGYKYICAYIVPENEFNLEELKDRLRKVLPEYMIPSYFICLDKIPITLNGKVDYNMLPDINKCACGKDDDMADEDENDLQIEQKMKELLLEVIDYNLQIEDIHINDNLDNLGINSINFIKYVVSLENEYDIEFDDDDLNLNRFITFQNVMLYVKGKL